MAWILPKTTNREVFTSTSLHRTALLLATLPGGFAYEPAGAGPAAISVPVMGLTGLLILLMAVFGLGLFSSTRV